MNVIRGASWELAGTKKMFWQAILCLVEILCRIMGNVFFPPEILQLKWIIN